MSSLPVTSCGDGTFGFTSMGTLNAAMALERNRLLDTLIDPQASPIEPYVLTVCPGAILDAEADGNLLPVLSDVTIRCGDGKDPIRSCSFLNGGSQGEINSLDTSQLPE